VLKYQGVKGLENWSVKEGRPTRREWIREKRLKPTTIVIGNIRFYIGLLCLYKYSWRLPWGRDKVKASNNGFNETDEK